MTDWKDRLSCFTPKYASMRIGEDDVHFYAISPRMLFKLRAMASPIAKAVSTLLGSKATDSGSKVIETPDGRQIETMPISLELAQMRSREQADAVAEIINAITDTENARVVAEVVMDSLAEVFQKTDKASWPPVDEFLGTVPLPTFGMMILGVVKANQEVLGPLAGQVTAAVGAAVAKVEARMTEARTVEADATNGTPG